MSELKKSMVFLPTVNLLPETANIFSRSVHLFCLGTNIDFKSKMQLVLKYKKVGVSWLSMRHAVIHQIFYRYHYDLQSGIGTHTIMHVEAPKIKKIATKFIKHDNGVCFYVVMSNHCPRLGGLGYWVLTNMLNPVTYLMCLLQARNL